MNRKVNKLQSVQALRALAVIIVMLLTSATTGIEAVENIQFSMFNVQSDSWHDLQGRRLSEKPTRKGLYLQNGKKVVVK